jgi:ferrous iron transport protein A
MSKAKTVANLTPGEKGEICCFKDDKLALKLLDMGCLPGTEVEMKFTAPLGDPICISVDGYRLSLRMAEASTISLVE